MFLFDKQDVLEKAKDFHVKFIRLQFTDVFGVLKNIAITVEDLEKALEGEMVFDSSAVEGMITKRKREIRLMPDPSTFDIFPWRPREGAVARLICDIYNHNGTPYEGCPRQVLKKVVSEMQELDLNIQVGSEVEFYLFNSDEKGYPTTVTHDRAGYCDLTPIDLGENARRDMVLTLEEMGIAVSSSHHELGPGQHAIALKLDECLAAADKITTFRFVIRTIAQRHGLYASFMPKPLPDATGSGMPFFLFLYSGDQNILLHGQENLAPKGRGFISGILENASAITAITNPTINSFKRLMSSISSPKISGWSWDRRDGMIRVPEASIEDSFIEVRNPDPAANPYLALSVLLKAGLEGIKRQLPLIDPLPTDSEKTSIGSVLLPKTLETAVNSLIANELIQRTLGKQISDLFIKAKLDEWERFSMHVHPWELDEYLKVF